MSDLRVIGIDPGPIPGIVVLDFEDKWLRRTEAIQCTHGVACDLVEGLLLDVGNGPPDGRVVVQVEKFVVRGRAGRSSTPAAGGVTRELVFGLGNAVRNFGPVSAGYFERTASEVKPWATDARLVAGGLLEATKGMRHARDAARHALFAAVHDGGAPDPLSKEWIS